MTMQRWAVVTIDCKAGAGKPRTLMTRDGTRSLVASGAVPGEVYEPPEFTEEGQPDPMAG